MKKLLIIACLICCLSMPVLSVNGQKAEHLSDFYDDFESYEVSDKFVENNKDFTSNWTNNLFKGKTPLGMDKHIAQLAKIKYEDDSNKNKVFAIDNSTSFYNTFFYMAPSNDFRVKNFTASFKVKFLENHIGWVGLSLRKEENLHYTGTNNLLLIVQREKDSNTLKAHAHRCVGGTMSKLSDVLDGGLYGDKLKLTENTTTMKSANEWTNFRYEVVDRNYKIFMDDKLLLDLTFDIKMFDDFGYVSFNCCQADILLDDFKVEVNDSEFPPVLDEPDLIVPDEVEQNQNEKHDKNSQTKNDSESKSEKNGCSGSLNGNLLIISFALSIVLILKKK